MRGDHHPLDRASRRGALHALLALALGLGCQDNGWSPPPDPTEGLDLLKDSSVVSIWETTSGLAPCGDVRRQEDFSSGRYDAHRYRTTLPAGAVVRVQARRTAGDWSPLIVVYHAAGELIYNGVHDNVEGAATAHPVTAGFNEAVAEVELRATSQVAVELYVTSWEFIMLERQDLPRDAAYELHLAQECDADGDADGDVDGDGDGDGDGDADGDVDADADGDGDGDVDGDGDGDGDADIEPLPESCEFGYDTMFPVGKPTPPWSEPEESFEEFELALFDEGVDQIAHAEPAPEGTWLLRAKDPDDPDLTMPSYSDTMPLFGRGRAWDSETRCYETPTGVQLLTESEAWDLYRRIAELTTGVTMNTTPGFRTVLGLRGTYPGTFAWHGNRPDYFNDTLVLLWIDDDGAHHVREFPVNTDTGAHSFGYHSSSSLYPNRRYRYDNSWHRSYNALHIQEDGYRVRDDANGNGHWDSDRNGWLTPRTSDDHFRTGGGHNIHMGSVGAPLGAARVDSWSAGCQVIPGMANWTEFIYRAWTGSTDPVDYFLVDARDIEPEVWEPCAERDGSHRCPILIGSLPFTDTRSTEGGTFDSFDRYNCSEADESGPEVLYLLRIDRSGTLRIGVTCPAGVDIDVHLLEGDDANACLERHNTELTYAVTPGRYLIAADTWSDGTTPQAGSYTLTVSLN